MGKLLYGLPCCSPAGFWAEGQSSTLGWAGPAHRTSVLHGSGLCVSPPCSLALSWRWWCWRGAGIAQCPAGLRDECPAAHAKRAATDWHWVLPLLPPFQRGKGVGEKWEGNLCKEFQFPALCCDEAPPKQWQPALGVSSGDSLLNKGGGNV